VDVDFFSPGVKKQSNEWHLVSSGRLVGWKGFANLIEAVAKLRDEHGIAARLTLAGDGPERGALDAQIARLNLVGHVALPGLLAPEPLRDLLRSSDLYVLPSIGLEAFSISALEGACCGLPLLLSNQVGLAGFLTEADCSIYPARDVGALVSSLKRLHALRYDERWADACARHARMREQFAPEHVARRILDLIVS
jgi:glycogen(starch) synthase